MRMLVAVLALAAVAGCRSGSAEAPGDPSPRPEERAGAEEPAARALEMRELFPHVRADVARRVVEFDAVVPIDAVTPMRDGSPPRVYLEVIACTPDTKEHETLVVTRARPSHVHAALLAAGFRAGSPGSWEWTGEVMRSIPPTGDVVVVEIVYQGADGREVVRPASDFVVNAETGARLGEAGFRFAGSRMAVRSGREVYDADGTGTLVGLATFGAETVAWGDVYSPEASVQEPEWIADPTRMPRVDTNVVVRLRAP